MQNKQLSIEFGDEGSETLNIKRSDKSSKSEENEKQSINDIQRRFDKGNE